MPHAALFHRLIFPPKPMPWPMLARRAGGLIAYGLTFALLHRLAGLWAFGMAYSLWFPAAGLRFAYLWRAGAAAAPGVALAELLAPMAAGEMHLGHPA